MVDVRDLGSVEALPAERLEAEVLAVAGQVAAGTCAFLVLVGEFDRRGLCESWECLSTAHWLGWKAGIGLHAAREQVRVGRRLRELPLVRAAFAEGRLSYSKVRALTRVAVPDNEAGLVDLALHGTAAQVEQACGRLRRYADPLADDADLKEGERRGVDRCHVSWCTDDDGHLVGSFRLPPDEGEIIRRAVDAAVQAMKAAEPEAERDAERLDRRRVRALAAIASAWLADPGTGTGATPEVIVHVDATALAALTGDVPAPLADVPAGTPDRTSGDVPAGTPDRTSGDVPAGTPEDPLESVAPNDADVSAARPPTGPDRRERVSTQGWEWPVRTSRGVRLSLDAMERLVADAGIRWIIDLPDGTQLDAAPHRRLPNRAQRRALLARDGHCRFPGCSSRHRLRAHHIIWWTRGGPTVMSNLVLLCAKHHHAVHDRQWSCTGTAEDLHWHRPDGQRVRPEAPALSGVLAELVTSFEHHGLDITTRPGGHWAGDTIDWACFFAALAPPPVPTPT